MTRVIPKKALNRIIAICSYIVFIKESTKSTLHKADPQYLVIVRRLVAAILVLGGEGEGFDPLVDEQREAEHHHDGSGQDADRYAQAHRGVVPPAREICSQEKTTRSLGSARLGSALLGLASLSLFCFKKPLAIPITHGLLCGGGTALKAEVLLLTFDILFKR